MTYYHYAILRKGKEYLAVFSNPNTSWELGHYYDQGYAFIMDASAFNANAAINIAKQNEGAEIIRLQAALDTLRQDFQKLLDENQILKFGSSYRYSSNMNAINPLEVMGFKNNPSLSELKSRYRELSQKIHPDKGGNNYLFVLIKNAYEQLKKTIV